MTLKISKEEKKIRLRKQKNNWGKSKFYCNICDTNHAKANKSRHYKSLKHIKNKENFQPDNNDPQKKTTV